MRSTAIIRTLLVLFTLLSTWYFADQIFSSKWNTGSLRHLFKTEVKGHVRPKKILKKCGNEKDCPKNYFAFKVISGAANVIGPSICVEDKILMSNVKNNIGPGLNIALVNASTAEVIKTGYFNMYSGDVKEVKTFLEPVKDGTLIIIVSYDEPATKLDDQIRDLFVSYGSSYAKKLGFRDSWAFIGGKGLKNKSPFEQHIANNKDTNKYDGWPEVIEMRGCVPRKMD